MPKKKDMSYLHTPAMVIKRTKAIRRAFRKKKRLARLFPVALPPEGVPPVIAYEGDTARGRHKRTRDEHERLDVVKGLLATVAMIMGRDK